MRVIILLALCFSIFSCGKNILPIGSKETQDAKLEQAKLALDDNNPDSAISTLTPLTNFTDNNVEKARLLLASAYAGKAGFEFLKATDNILSSANPDPIVGLYGMRATVVDEDITNIDSAITTLTDIDPLPANRPVDINYLISILYAYKASSVIQLHLQNIPYADLPSSSIDPCSSSVFSDTVSTDIRTSYSNAATALSGSNQLGAFLTALNKSTILNISTPAAIKTYINQIVVRKSGVCLW